MNQFNDPKVNLWLQFDGNNFLSELRDTSAARVACRERIKGTLGSSGVLMEIGVGGLNERIALDEWLRANPTIQYVGTDWSPHFIAHGAKMFPNDLWHVMDIEQSPPSYISKADIVYSQHVLEHCGGLCPALRNMLSLARAALINIFFLPPGDVNVVNHAKYPIYHNTYSRDHIRQVCNHHGFQAEFEDCENASEPTQETVLIATRRATA